VNDPGGVRDGEGRRDLHRDVQGLSPGQGTACQTIAQRLAVDVFHRDEVAAFSCASQRMDRTDVGMIEPGGGAGLLLEAAHARGIGGDRSRKQLEGNVAREEGVGGEPDFAHPARAKRAHELVLVEAAASSQRHRDVRGFYVIFEKARVVR
jgi:hypothetical protein